MYRLSARPRARPSSRMPPYRSRTRVGRIDRSRHVTPSPSTTRATRATPATRSPRRCWPTAFTRSTTSIKLGRPRGITAAWAEDPAAWSRSSTRSPSRCCWPPPSSCSTGLSPAAFRAGPARRDRRPRAYDAPHVHCRRAGRRRRPGRARRRPAPPPVAARGSSCVDEQSRSRRRTARRHRHDRRHARAGVGRRRDRRRAGHASPDVTAPAAHHRVRALRRRLRARAASGAPTPAAATPRAAVSRQRVWRIRAAPDRGRHRRARASRSCSTDNDRPGIMLAARRADLPAPLRRARSASEVVVFTTNDSAYAAAFDLHDAGVADHAVVDARPTAPALRSRRCAERGIARHGGHRLGGQRHPGRRPHHRTPVRRPRRRGRVEVPCDVLLVSGGWNPAVHLFSQARGKLRYDDVARRLRARASPRRASTSPDRRGRRVRPAGCLRGRQAATSAWSVGFDAPHARIRTSRSVDPDRRGAVVRPDARPPPASSSTSSATPPSPTSSAPSVPGCARWSTSSATPRSAPRTTRARPPASSPRASPPSCSAPAHRGPRDVTTFRPPYTPVAFAALAGREPRRPVRPGAGHRRCTTGTSRAARCSRTSASGSAPRYYPQPGEDMDDRGAARVRRRADRSRHPRRLDARQDRRAGSGRRRVPRPALHEHDEQPEGRA